MKNKPYQRNVSDNEYLYTQLQKLYSPLTIQLIVEGQGEIDIEDLQKAVQCASEACPNARVIMSGSNWVDSQKTPPVRVMHGYEFNGYDFDHIELFEQSLDPENGPTSEVLILRLNPMVLLFRVFHGTMDGKGTLLWIYNIFRSLRGEPLVEITSTETDLSFMRQHKHFDKKNRLTPKVRTLSHRYFTKKTKIWRQRITLTGKPSCMVARIAEMITKHSFSFQNRFLIPVDIRRHDNSHLSNSNLTLPIFLETTKEDSWTHIHQNLLNRLQDNQEMNLSSADLGLMTKIPQFLLKSGIHAMNVFQWIANRQLLGGVISNLGMVDLDALTTNNFRAKTLYSMTIQHPFSPFTVSIASNPFSTEVMFSCYEHDTLIAMAKNIVKDIKEELSSSYQQKKYNNTQKIYPSHETVVYLIEKQINTSPNAIAVQDQNNSITYKEFGKRVDQICTLLASQGIGVGDRIGIFMSRNMQLMPAIVAALKMGAIYIPIDDQSPQERINQILGCSNLSLCITEEGLKDRLSTLQPNLILLLPDFEANVETIKFDGCSKSTHIAYQMYTSGSTGLPKGVQIEHRSLTNYLLWAKESYGVNELSTFPLFASIAFDSTITSMFLPLIAGAKIKLFEEPVSHVTMKKIIESPNITHVKLSPAHLQLAVKIQSISCVPKTLIVGGEQLNTKLVEKFHALYGHDWKIINEYGPTEATVGCITYVYHPKHCLSGPAVPIGSPIMNTKAFLLDHHRHPVAMGEIGEIYLSGDCLARGYANDKCLTDEKFVMLDQHTRAYRTGDLAQFNENNELVYIGRIDNQINICGHRVELGEIESAILDYQGITDSAVIVRKNNQGKDVLTAYYTSECSVDNESIKKHLQKHLPAYMQVQFFVHLDQMPLNLHHKIDKNALSIYDIRLSNKNENNETIDTQEKELVEIWKSVLELDENTSISVTDNFYELGGDSLSMLILINEVVTKVIGKENEGAFMKNLSQIIKSPTIKNFSKLLIQINSTTIPAKSGQP